MARPDIKRFEETEQGIIPNIRDEFSPLKKVLVVPIPENPTSFLDLEVNPIQAESIKKLRQEGITEDVIDKPLVTPQHAKFLDVLSSEGVELIYSRVPPGRPGHTPLFTRDVGAVIGNKVFPASLKYEYRRGEVLGLTEAVEHSLVLHPGGEYFLEGGDIAIIEPGIVLVGIGNRTDIRGLSLLRYAFPDVEFIEVDPHDPEGFHLDTTLGVLGEKHLVYLPGKVPEDILVNLKKRGYTLVEAEVKEYASCCTNVLAISDRKVIAAAENKVTNDRIRASGVQVLEVELSSILTSGGGPHCLTLPLVRG